MHLCKVKLCKVPIYFFIERDVKNEVLPPTSSRTTRDRVARKISGNRRNNMEMSVKKEKTIEECLNALPKKDRKTDRRTE